MISFELSDFDQAKLDVLKEEGLICRKYARYYDENEDKEIPPDELPEAKDFKPTPNLAAKNSEDDSGLSVMAMYYTIYRCWGDYAVKLRQPKMGGLGNAALMAAGSLRIPVDVYTCTASTAL